ncbi:MAG: radical SAM protein [Planctomycetota bacterium]
MDVLLINPFVERMHLELSYAENFRPPLGLAYLAGVLEAEGRSVAILDALVLGVRDAELRELVLRERPRYVGISTHSPTRYECFRTAELVKDALGGDVTVLAGGPHVSAAAEDTLRHVPAIDFVVRGEGEEVLAELLRVLDAGGDVGQVRGVSWRRGDEIVENPPQPNVADLDALPRPARHLLPMHCYRTRMPSTHRRATTVLTSRGCPARCTFCTRDWFSRDTRYHSPVAMADEFEEIVDRWGTPSVIVQDDTFTLKKQRIHAFCEELRSRGLPNRRRAPLRWLATTRVDCVNLELLKDMKASGCEIVTFGVESMNNETLKWLKKGIDTRKIRRAIDWAREAGLRVRVTYLLGVGEETEEDIVRSAAAARTLPVDKLKANVGLSVYPGTPSYGMAIEAGVLAADYSYAEGYRDPEKRYGNGETPRWYTPHVPRERLLQLRRETEANVLFTRPSAHEIFHKGRKFASRIRRHPVETARQVANIARAVTRGSGLRERVRSVTDH